MDAQARRITPQELDKMMAAGPVTVLDMRRDWERSDSKIPGAVRVHPDAYEAFASSLDRSKPVVTYCT